MIKIDIFEKHHNLLTNMAINYTTRDNPKKTDDKQSLGVQIIFFALNFLAVPFSAYATFQGYRETAGGDIMAIILATLTAVLFFGLNYLIMDKRRKGESHALQAVGYLIPLGISFIGNFTNFYGNQVEATVLKNDLAQYSKTLKTTYESSMTALDNSTGLVDFELKLNTQLNQLKVQYKSRWGSECNKEWAKIKQLCGGNLTKIFGKKTYNKAEDIANNYFASLKQTKNANINILKDQINNLYKPLLEEIEDIKKDKEVLKRNGSDLINKIRIANDDIGEIIKGKITDFVYKSETVHNKVGKENPMQTLKHAWGEKNITSIETITAAFFSLIIDLVTLLFIFLAIPYNSNKRKNVITGPRSL